MRKRQHFDAAHYVPERDGSLDEYLKVYNGSTAFPLFKGIDQFELLRQEGWLEPRMSIIRLMWNLARGDEHFQVGEDYKLEGIPNDYHGGRPGIHEPTVILHKRAPAFEAHHLYGLAWREKMERK